MSNKFITRKTAFLLIIVKANVAQNAVQPLIERLLMIEKNMIIGLWIL